MGPNFGAKIKSFEFKMLSQLKWGEKISTTVNNSFNPTRMNGHFSCSADCTNFRPDYELSGLWIRIVMLPLTTTSNKKNKTRMMIIIIMIIIIIIMISNVLPDNCFHYQKRDMTSSFTWSEYLEFLSLFLKYNFAINLQVFVIITITTMITITIMIMIRSRLFKRWIALSTG